MGIFLTWVLIVFFSTYSYAGLVSQEECSDTDIRETNPKIKNNPELKEFFSTPLDQDSINWCYGFVAADLVSAELGFPVSATHTSNIYNEYIQNSFYQHQRYKIVNLFNDNAVEGIYEYGNIKKAIKELIKKGKVCLEADLPYDRNYSGEMLGLIQSLEWIKKQSLREAYTLENSCRDLQNAFFSAGFKDVDVEALSASVAKKSITDIIDQAAEQECKDRMINVPQMKIKNILKPHTKWGKRRYFKAINDALEKGHPVALSIKAEGFTELAGNHAVSAIARRWKSGQCEYKIRNSWGRTCSPYLKKIDCNEEEGSFWLNAEDLQKFTFQIDFIQD